MSSYETQHKKEERMEHAVTEPSLQTKGISTLIIIRRKYLEFAAFDILHFFFWESASLQYETQVL